MKIKEVIENLQNLVKEHPEMLEFEAITSIDEEGNSFNTVYFTPTVGYFFEDCFVSEKNKEDIEEGFVLNAVCIN